MRISGLNSGIDTEQMIKDIMTAQRIPVDRVFQQKVQAEWKRDAYRDVNTKLSRFDTFVFDLRLQGTFQKNVATSSRTDILQATATGTAKAGTYDLKVTQLAESARFISNNVEFGEESGFKMQSANGEKMVEIVIGEGDNLASIADKINSNKELGISAFVHGESISFTTIATGEQAKIVGDGAFIRIFGNAEDEGPEGTYEYATGQDAEVEINGLATSRSSNTFDLNGITVNLLEAQPGASVRIEVRQDVDAVVDKVKEFVNLYNELVDELNLSTREEVFRDFPPLTDAQRADLSDKEVELWEEKARSGVLRSDSTIRGILSEMRLALGGSVQGEDGEGSMSLAQIGITTGSWYEYGRLNINEDKLRSAIEENPEGVTNLFSKSSEDASETGLARRLSTVLSKGMDRLTQTAGKATDPYDQSSFGERIREYESRIDAMEERLLRYEQNQWNKFVAMERVLGQLYSQGDWLTQQLTALQG